MIFDLDTLELKNIISKPLLDLNELKKGVWKIDRDRIEKQYQFQREDGIMHMSEYNQYFGSGLQNNINEPFAFLHH